MHIATQSNKNNNYMSIPELFDAIRFPLIKTFDKQVFTVVGEVSKVNKWETSLYVVLVSRNNDKAYNMTVSITENVLSQCNIKVVPHMKLLIGGTVTLSKGGNIQLKARNIDDLGCGQMQRQIEEWKIQCRPLFERTKNSLPLLCKRIALISNPNIQGFTDFSTHLMYGEIVVVDTKMQGKNVAEEIAVAIKTINEWGNFDCICIVRGGGDPTDLFDYNKPVLLKAIAESKIAVTTAIGHETDNLLCDYVADIRFSTPTDAARQLSQRVDNLLTEIKQKESKLRSIYSRAVDGRERELEKERLHKNNRILTVAVVVTSIALLIILYKLL